MYKFMSGLAVAAVVAFVAPALLRAEEDKIAIDKLPKEVSEAVKKKFPDAEFVEAEKGDENGKIVYEIKIKSKKANLEVVLTPEGKILSVEKEIDVKDVPKVVMEALEKKYPKATVKSAEEVSKDDKIAEYELTIVTADKKDLEVTFDKDGKFVEEEKVAPKKDEPKKDKKEEKKDK